MMSDMTTPPPADETPTVPLPQAQNVQPAVAPVAVEAAASAAQPAGKKDRAAAGYVFAVSAAIVLAVGLAAVSFGAGVFVGRMGGRTQGVAASAPSAGGQSTAPNGMGAPQGQDDGTGSDNGSGNGSGSNSGGRGPGGGMGGMPGGGQNGAPSQQNTPSSPSDYQ